MEQIRIHELEIDSKEIPNLCKNMNAYDTDLKCFVYMDSKGELTYFEDTPKFREAHQESTKECLRRNQ
jgi:hypothetical protein